MSDILIEKYTKKEREHVKFHKYSADRVGGIRGSGSNRFFILFNSDKALVRFEANDSSSVPEPDSPFYALRKLHKYAKRTITKRNFLNVSWNVNIDIKDIVFLLILLYLVFRTIIGK